MIRDYHRLYGFRSYNILIMLPYPLHLSYSKGKGKGKGKDKGKDKGKEIVRVLNTLDFSREYTNLVCIYVK